MSCEYCEGNKKSLDFKAFSHDVYISTENTIMFRFRVDERNHYIEFPINNCPMCGEKLGDGE